MRTNNPYVQRRTAAFDAARALIAQQVGDAQSFMPGLTVDAANGIGFLISQLAYTEAQTFEVMREPLQYAQLIPISSAAGEWAETIRYETSDNVGRGRRIHGSAKDIPMANVLDGDATMPVHMGGIGYEYTTEELRRTAYLRRPLPTRKLNAAIDGYERHMNDVAINGEQDLPGFIKNPQIASGNAPNGNWAPGSPDLILADVNAGLVLVWQATNKVDQVTDIVLPNEQYAMISTTRMAGFSDKTILSWLKENNIAKLEKGINLNITAVSELAGAGAAGADRMIFYVKSPSRLVMHIPMPLRFLAPQPVALSMQIPGEYKYGGVEWYYPQSAYYMDGI